MNSSGDRDYRATPWDFSWKRTALVRICIALNWVRLRILSYVSNRDQVEDKKWAEKTKSKIDLKGIR